MRVAGIIVIALLKLVELEKRSFTFNISSEDLHARKSDHIVFEELQISPREVSTRYFRQLMDFWKLGK